MTVIASNVNEPLPEPEVRGLRGTTHVDEVNIDCEAFFNDKGKWGEHYIGKKFRCAVVNGEKRHVKLTEKIW